MVRGSPLARLLAEVGLWFFAPAIFLWLYVAKLGVPATAVLPHARVAATIWLALAVVRLAATLLRSRRAAFWISSFAVAAVITTVLFYYTVVVIGLRAWGRVITWELIRSYALQLPALADALGLSLALAGGVLTVVFGVVLIGVALYIRRFDWTLLLRARLSPSITGLIGGAAVAVVAIQVYLFTAAPWTVEREPLSMTVFPEEVSRKMEGNLVDRMQAERLGRADDAARAVIQPAPAAVRRNVVLIVVDALRSDHLGVLGYSRDTTPQLAKLATEAQHAAFATIHSSCAESACGLTSLASGRYVHQFSDRPITLTEMLKRNGYAVHLILSGDHTHFYGLREAYGKVDTYYDGSMARGYYMNDDRLVLDGVASLPEWSGVPTMFQLHLMSSHVLGRREPEFRTYEPASNYGNAQNRTETHGLPNPAAVNYYDNGVLQSDAEIARVLRTLGSKGYLKDAVVVITGDHGELLGEHDMYSHGSSVFEEVLRVPLIMMWFGYQPKNKIEGRGWGSQVDIAPTILAELGIAKPATWTGVALQDGPKPDFTYFQEAPYVGLYDRRDPQHLWKYYVDIRSGAETFVEPGAVLAGHDDAAPNVSSGRLREWRALLLPTMPGGLRAH